MGSLDSVPVASDVQGEGASHRPAFGVSSEGALAVVTARGPVALAGVAAVQSVEIELARVPPDQPLGPVDRFRHRRGRLRAATVAVALDGLGARVAAPANAEIAATGLRVRAAGAGLRIAGRVAAAGRDVGFTARVSLARRGQRELLVAVDELNLFGFLPMPAPLVAGRLLAAALGAGTPGPSSARARRPLRWRLELDLLETALLETFAAEGWRLPDSTRARLETIDLRDAEGLLVFGWRAAGAERAPASGQAAEDDASRGADALLARGQLTEALAAYRDLLRVAPQNVVALRRAMEILVSAPATLDDAGTLAGQALARNPDLVPALLCQAAVAAERGRAAQAARLYRRIAALADARGETEDAEAARAAAAEQDVEPEETAPTSDGDAAAARERPEAESTIAPEPGTVAEPAQSAPPALPEDHEPAPSPSAPAELAPVPPASNVEGAGGQAALIDAGEVPAGPKGVPAPHEDDASLLAAVPSGEEATAATPGAAEAAPPGEDAEAALAGGTPGEDAEAALAGGTPGEDAGAALAGATPGEGAEAAPAGATPGEGAEAAPAGATDDAPALEGSPFSEDAALIASAWLGGRPEEPPPSPATNLEAESAAAGEAAGLIAPALELPPAEAPDLEAEAVATPDAVAPTEAPPGPVPAPPPPEDRLTRLLRMQREYEAAADEDGLAEVLDELATGDGPEAASAIVTLGELALAGRDDAVETAAEGHRRLLDGELPSELPRSELARRAAALAERRGDEEGALRYLRQSLDEGAEGSAAAQAWRRIVELHARRGDPKAAAMALIASADDAGTGEEDKDRAASLLAAAEILRKRLGLTGDAVSVLERAVALDPASGAALDALHAAATESEDWTRVAEVLERKIEAAQAAADRRPLLAELADIYDRRLGRPDQARATHKRRLADDPTARDALLWLARDAARGGALEEAAEYDRRLADMDPPPSGAEAEEIYLRLGSAARGAGAREDAEAWFQRAREAAPDSAAPLDNLIALYDAPDRREDAMELLAARAALERSPEGRAPFLRRRAALIEAEGHIGRAAAAYGEVAEIDPSAIDELIRLSRPLQQLGESEALALLLEALTEELVRRRELERVDRVFEIRASLEPEQAIALRAERARVRMLAPGGAAGALELLRGLPVGQAPDEALALWADLEERQGQVEGALVPLHELEKRALDGADEVEAARLRAHIEHLESRPRLGPDATVTELEQALDADPADAAIAERLVAAYAALPDRSARIEATEALLRRALGLTPERRKEIHASLGEAAEAEGDLDAAEDAYWRAASIEPEASSRADLLVSHARVLLARGEVETAKGQLEEALAAAPTHAQALALMADLAFRAQDWDRARELYARLAQAPGAAEAIPRDLLLARRASLAALAGNNDEAESCYREVALANPRHIDARRALADLALGRGDVGAAAMRLEEVLRLLPLDALDQLLDVRHRLGQAYVQLQDWGSARYYLELVLAQDPGRIPALEALADVYQNLGLFREEAAACGRLSRLYFEPGRRAQALYRQGEVLRTRVGDEAAAFEAFLKASDLDPRLIPNLLRLVESFWDQGDFENLADIGAELERAGFVPSPEHGDLALQLLIGGALAGGQEVHPRRTDGPWDGARAAALLAKAASHLGARPPSVLAPAVASLLALEPADAAPGLSPALAELVEQDPSGAGAVRALAVTADREGRTGAARALYALLVFVDPHDGATVRLGELGPAPPPDPQALSPGATDHPDAAGPLRAALRALSGPLLGFDAEASTQARQPGSAEGLLKMTRAAGLRRLAEVLGAPPVSVGVNQALPEHQARVVPVPTRPAVLDVTPAAAALGEREWGFLAGRALDLLRTGTAAVQHLGAEELMSLLAGAEARLASAEPPEADATARAAFDWLSQPEPASELPSGEAADRLLAELRQARATPVDATAFLKGCLHAANRIGLLVSSSPLDALLALGRLDELAPASAPGDVDERRGIVRTSPVRELVRYMMSPAYEQALVQREPA